MKPLRIHKGNYEEFFLLYVDNELSSEERMAVEAFAASDAELQEELELLMDTRLPDEKPAEDWNKLLLKAETGAVIDDGNVEEFQLMKIDGELDMQQEKELQQWHEFNPDAYTQFQWLEKTKLASEPIDYPYKAELYKSSGRIVLRRWLAAAAVLLVSFGLMRLLGDNADIPVDKSVKIVATNPVTKAQAPRIIDNEQVEKQELQPEIAAQTKVKKQSVSAVPTSKSLEEKINQEEETRPVVQATKIITKEDITTAVNQPADVGFNITRTDEPVATVTNDYVSEALHRSTEAVDELDVESVDRRKKGIRGIVRKATRIYHKVTEGEVQRPVIRVANWQITL